ncbi:Uncharacterized protein OS=Acidiphilium multivorum (strain DSM 11245 / JCM 8867 / AIU301) GN=ACMV_24800 PE=4 SV=1 [Gemmata massiliana]|uniref:DUF4105 domain-containing protein n=1 Tax=Gemmata massiliana TaxID=1210884 RepID=A0A6P2D6W5_9BACT|nr:hypothetical protein [Gemmata massiliana]VTR96205.1 Uncharacterized protein OS=Acidiphilium multivorum (strain DSM 11245 / JCM 8867 / AIU301) GN=ACMV_24800 PE=4 SV=1 [Gemmata massiliana]
MASYVFVWEQNMYLQKEVSGREWPGHSSMNIGDTFDAAFVNNPNSNVSQMDQFTAYTGGLTKNYVSYWPNTAAATFGVADVFGTRKQSRCKRSVVEDLQAEGYLPDWVIKLNTNTNQETRMMSEWASIRDKPKSTYGAFKKNCSTIVSRVMHAGGLYAKKWAVNCNWVWAPGDVRQLALKVGGQPMTWANFVPLLGATAAQITKKYYVRETAYNHVGAEPKHHHGKKIPGIR